ncbi:MAG TPA: lamin tail domain-containing protein [Bacteroidales bacterium]|nr:lamin tail domain-containing protein [Bacteroidales bacterium]
MRKLIFIILLLPLISYAQFSDDFSDENFSENPAWNGNTNKFVVDASTQLQLYENPQAAGNSYLATTCGAINDASWEFLVKLSFNPSSTNYCEVYLVSNSSDLNSVTNGYFVKIGNTEREVSLYRKDVSTSTMIINGTDGRLNTTTVNVRVKVTRDAIGNWTLMSDTLGGTDYYSEGSFLDNTYFSSTYFGVRCVYTETRSQHFFFDDFVVSGDPFIDDIPPQLLSSQVIDEQHFLMIFNEALDPGTASDINNYSVNNGIGNPVDASFYEPDVSKVLLEFSASFISGTNYILQYQNIGDLSLNPVAPGFINFSYVSFEPGMIVINEIMADPDPPVGLPEAEYIELYNTSDYTVDLTDWTYTIGTSSKILSSYQLEPGEYLILCHTNFVSEFELFGNTLGIESFPSITNGGQTIVLKDDGGQEIDRVTYSDAWYQDSDKEEGGWSLEKIDPLNICSAQTNWIASESEFGGTPGTINSVYAVNNDTIAPEVISVSVSSGNEITVVFSEPVDTLTSLVLTNYEVNPDFGNPFYAIVDPSNEASVILQFPNSFEENMNYTVIINNISDWCGNIMTEENISFILYNPADYDIIITEIMADPEPVVLLPEVEYIELYNRTEYDLDLTNWTINVGTSSRALPYCLIPSGGYLVLCHSDKADLFNNIDNIVGVESFPSLTNGGASLTLKDKNNKVIHTVSYSDTWYKDNFKMNGGYSLEMIDLNNVCEGEENWQASKNISGGTPGTLNSVNANNPDITLPYPIAAEAIMPDTLIIYFSEILKSDYANDSLNFEVEEFGNPIWISAAEPDFSTITMKFDGEFEVGRLYYLNIKDSIRDCAGNKVAINSSFRFAIADSVVSGDIVINEILFNPMSGGSDFVELYNKSDKILDLKHLWFCNKDENGNIKDSYVISDISRLLEPQEYCAISEDTDFLIDNYTILSENNLFDCSNLPSMPDDEGNILLSDRYLNEIDIVYYTDDQHYQLLASNDGVSLERINFERLSSDKSNWHSASQTVGFATPGYQNSQYAIGDTAETTIGLSTEVFSPDNDGYNDRLTISYKLEGPGYTATMAIYSSDGRFITYIVNNEMLAMEGNLFWDGFDNGNNICPSGIYVLYVEMFNMEGKKIVEKHAVVLSKMVY